MRIALIAEGCYPYVTGGVSSWVQNLIKELPDAEFDVLAITADAESRQARYEAPANLNQVLDYPLAGRRVKAQPVHLSDEELAVISHWLEMDTVVEDALGLFADVSRLGDADTFLASEEFYTLIREQYARNHEAVAFLSYYWSWRNMLTPLLRLLQQPVSKYDLIQTTATGYAGVLAATIHATQGTPVILTEHGIYAREREEDILQTDWLDITFKPQWIKFFRYLAKLAYHAAEEVITLSLGNQAHQRLDGAAPEKLALVPNGVRVNDLMSLPRHTFTEDALQIGAIIRMVPIKDIKTLLYACAELAVLRVPYACYLMGTVDEDPAYAEECRALIKELGIQEQVHVLGQVNIKDWLPKLDVLVLSSISEGQPLAVLEGMAAGIPWVCTDVGACRELLYGASDDFGQAGFVVRPVDPGAIAAHLAWYYRHPAAMKTMGQNGTRRARRYYQLDTVAQAYATKYAKGRVVNGGA